MHGFVQKLLRIAPALAFGSGALGAGPSLAASNLVAPKTFVTMERHDPATFSYALRYGQEHLRGSRDAQFEIYLAGPAVHLVVPGSNFVQIDYMKRFRANPRLKIVACAETVRPVEKAAHRRVPLLPGVTVQPCGPRLKAMLAAGWQRAPGT